MQKTIIINTEPDKFAKRLWKLYSPYFYFFSIFLLLPIFNIHGNITIFLLYWTIILIQLSVLYHNCFKWATNAIKSVSITEDNFEIETFVKDVNKTYIIKKENIKTQLNWERGKPPILRLTLFDKDAQLLSFYSGGRKKNEYLFEDISLQIWTQKNGNPKRY